MKSSTDIITLEELIHAYEDIQEELVISAINIKFVNDSHYGDFELSIEFMGLELDQDLFEEDCPIAEYRIDLDTLLVNGASQIEKTQLFSIFDSHLQQLLLKEKTPIHWNSNDDESYLVIDFNAPGNELLHAMIQ